MMNGKIINQFVDEYAFLSNFFPCKIKFENYIFKCSESLYLAHKSGNEIDFEIFSKLDAREAKKFSKKINIQEDWEDKKIDVMRLVLYNKFTQNPLLKKKLIATGTAELIEGNWWKDYYWGVCNGVGENNLGKLLMELRNFINGYN